MKHTISILALLLVCGCATLSEDDCRAGAWRSIGFEDGAQGQPPDRIGAHREACSRYGVAPDFDLWKLGYDEGLTRYCTRANGFRVGVEGETYHGVCAGPAAAEFLPAYQDGRGFFDLQQAVNAAHGDLDSLRSDIEDARDEREAKRDEADDPETSSERRKELLDDIERLSERIGRLRSDRRALEDEIEGLEWDLENARSTLTAYYPEWRGY